jgi:tetratricopeptide (TPR) repeat protein
LIEKAISLDPSNPKYQMAKAKVHFYFNETEGSANLEKKHQNSINIYKQIIADHPQHHGAFYNLGKCYSDSLNTINNKINPDIS